MCTFGSTHYSLFPISICTVSSPEYSLHIGPCIPVNQYFFFVIQLNAKLLGKLCHCRMPYLDENAISLHLFPVVKLNGNDFFSIAFYFLHLGMFNYSDIFCLLYPCSIYRFRVKCCSCKYGYIFCKFAQEQCLLCS